MERIVKLVSFGKKKSPCKSLRVVLRLPEKLVLLILLCFIFLQDLNLSACVNPSLVCNTIKFFFSHLQYFKSSFESDTFFLYPDQTSAGICSDPSWENFYL